MVAVEGKVNCAFTLASHGISQLLGGRFHVWPSFGITLSVLVGH